MAWCEEDGVDDEVVRERLIEATDALMAEKTKLFGEENMRNIEKHFLLQTIDAKWREHLLTLEHLRSVVGFRGYAQRDPLNEYKNESFQLFEGMLDSLRADVTQKLSRVQPPSEEEQQRMIQAMQAQQQAAEAAIANTAVEKAGGPRATNPENGFDETDQSTWGNPGRNELCPCGSGEKFKHCHGRL